MENNKSVLAFDPGATTGFAAINGDGKVLATAAIFVSQLEGWLEFLSHMEHVPSGVADVVIETGPNIRHNSPVTRRVEAMLREQYPDATLVQPSQWKSHPAARRSRKLKLSTLHEKDAVGLADWLHATRSSSERHPRARAARTHADST